MELEFFRGWGDGGTKALMRGGGGFGAVSKWFAAARTDVRTNW